MNWSDLLLKYADTTFGILTIFVVCSFVLMHLAKLKEQRKQALDTLTLISVILKGKLGDKADLILNIWIEGLKKIQDGEFSRDDGVDQFVRYVRLAAASKGVTLTDEDVVHISQLVSSTLDIFLGKKQSEISLGVNKFAAMNAVGAFEIKR